MFLTLQALLLHLMKNNFFSLLKESADFEKKK
jgi:hypothetical protein